MKKLMTIMAAAATALFAFGDVTLPSGTSLEELTAGEALDPTKNDAGTGSDNTYWYLTGDDQASLLVTNYDNEVVLPARPEQFSGNNSNYLKIETSGRLYRSIGANTQDASAFATIGIGDGIYLDTLVQFTPAEDEFKAEAVESGDKIAIEYVEREDDPATVEDESYTNFVVRAGYVDAENSIVATNYYLALPDGVQFDKTAWHRLTVRAISNVGNAFAPVGFVIYVDGTNLVYDVNVAAGNQTYEESLNSVVKTYLYNDTTHALLPSLLRYGETNYDTLSAVAFNGNGSVDDISFTADKPGILPAEGTAVTIAWDANVATYTVVAGEDTLINAKAVSGAGSTNLLLDTSVATLTVTATYATGYEAGTWTVTGEGAAISGSTFTVAPGAELTIVSMFPQFEVDGDKYGSFEDALENAVGTLGSPATIKMLAPWTGDIAFDGENVNYIILDLAGQTLTGDSDAAIHTGIANIIITNSTVVVGHVVAPDFDEDKGGTAVVCDNIAATLTVAAGIFDGAIVSDPLGATIVVTGGKFYDNEYAEDPTGEFYLAADVDTEKYTISEADENFYFTVSESTPEPPAPTTYALTLPTGVNATATVTAGGVEVANISAIEEDTEIVVTWTADSGYKVTAGATENITMDSDKTAATPTVAAITYATLTIDTVANCTIVVSNATEAVASGAKFDVDEAVQLTVYRTPAEDYELDGYSATEQITMDQDRTVTAAVKQSGGDYPSYIDPTDTDAKAKYDSWSAYAGVTPAAAAELEDAFLLNCLPAEVEEAKAAFKITSISYDTTQEKWVVTYTDGYNERKYNGTVTVKQYSDVGCKTESSTGTFFKAVLQ